MGAMTNRYCEELGIDVPSLESVKDHREANNYTLLLVALLERGAPMNLHAVAERFEQAGVAPAEQALRSLQRCKPARAPVYRDGDLYALDSHSDDLDLWTYRLGLRPRRAQRTPVAPQEVEPSPGPEVPLDTAELEETWRDTNLRGHAVKRIVAAVLDAHGRPMAPEEVVSFIREQTRWHYVTKDPKKFRSKGSPIEVLEDGRWAIRTGSSDLRAARIEVRERVAKMRVRESQRAESESRMRKAMQALEQRREAIGDELARMRRVVVRSFPLRNPEFVALADVNERKLKTFGAGELETAREALVGYELIAAEDVRSVLRGIGYEPGVQRLAELGPPQKTKKLNRQGRTLKITTKMIIQHSCGISRPLGDRKKLRQYLGEGQTTKLRRRIEADAKSLVALYEYGCLHGCVRLRWGFLDELLSAPWVYRNERGLHAMMRQAAEQNRALEVVVGSAPGWKDPWSRARRCRVAPGDNRYSFWLLDESGGGIDELEVQRARLAQT